MYKLAPPSGGIAVVEEWNILVILDLWLPSAWRHTCTNPVCYQLWHSADTWTLTTQAQNKLSVAQTKKKEVCSTSYTRTERPTYGSAREDKSHISNERTMQWFWEGHTNSLKDDRWTSRVTTWRPLPKDDDDIASIGKLYGDGCLLSTLVDSDVYAPASERLMLEGKQGYETY